MDDKIDYRTIDYDHLVLWFGKEKTNILLLLSNYIETNETIEFNYKNYNLIYEKGLSKLSLSESVGEILNMFEISKEFTKIFNIKPKMLSFTLI